MKLSELTSPISEMVSCGAIAMRPNLLASPAPRRSKRKKPKMPHGNKVGSRIPTINQAGGRLGGNPQ